MKRYFLLLILILVGVITAGQAYAQSSKRSEQYTDSLETLIQKAHADTAKAVFYNQLAHYWFRKDPEKAVNYAQQSLQLSKGNAYYTALSHFYLGITYYLTAPSKAKKKFRTTIDLLKSDSSRRALSLSSRAWKNYGAVDQKVKGDNKTLMKILLDHSIPLARKAGDEATEAKDYAALALIYSNLLNYDKAISYYTKAIRMGRKSLKEEPKILVKFYIRLAQNYLKNKQYSSVKPYLDSAKVLLSNQPSSIFHVIYYKTIGMYYSKTKQEQQGLFNLGKALKLAKQLKLSYMASSIIFQKFRTYSTAKQYRKAKDMLLLVFRNNLISSKPRNKLRILNNLAKTDAHLGNMASAYQWSRQYSTLADSLHQAKVKSKIAALEAKYQSEKKQRQILALQNKSKKQQLSLQKSKTRNILLIAAILFFILICAIIYILYRNNRRKTIREAEAHRQKMKRMEQEHELDVYGAMLNGQEQERRRVARDLHDGVGGMLAGVKHKLSSITKWDKQDKTTELNQAIDQLDRSAQELRRTARNMMPQTLLRYDLKTALEELCNSLENEQTQVDFQAFRLKENIPQEAQVGIYRIIQELLANALKHGQATHILVQCSQNEGKIFITVEDNGSGFDLDVLEHKKGIGLSNIENRVNFLQGNFDIQSESGEGTNVNIEVSTHE